jgi:putative effector of murein hydrolase LrgA (UPF0299 family)
MFPEMRSVTNYIRKGWFVIIAYIIGFFIMLGLVGWHPHAPHRKDKKAVQTEQTILPAATDSVSH